MEPHRCMQLNSEDLDSKCCLFCGDPSQGDACKKCENTVRVRIGRALRGDPALAIGWNLWPGKQAFLVTAHGAYGDDLLRLLRSSLGEVHSTESQMSFVGVGTFMDEEDIRAKYKHKPRTLDAILKRAKRMTCPNTKIELIEDMQYTTVASSSESHTSTEKRVLEGTEEIVKPKKAKVVKAGRVVMVLSTTAQFRRLHAYEDPIMATIRLIDEEYTEIKQSIEEKGWGVNIPAYIHASHRALHCKKLEFLDKMDIIAETGLFDVEAFRDALWDVKQEAKFLLRRMRLQVQEAKSFGVHVPEIGCRNKKKTTRRQGARAILWTERRDGGAPPLVWAKPLEGGVVVVHRGL